MSGGVGEVDPSGLLVGEEEGGGAPGSGAGPVGRRGMAGWTRRHWVVRVHRWLGVTFSLLFLVWFLSGFVMMYAGFPEVGWKDRIDRGEPFPTEVGPLLSPGEAARAAGLAAAPDSFHLRFALGRGVWVFQLPDGERRSVHADDGTPFRVEDPALAGRLAMAWEGGGGPVERVVATERLDQWTPRSFYLPHMPIQRVYLDDGRGTRVYVSGTTGDVVQRHDRMERFWGWLGPIPHWIYPRDLIVRRPVWRQVVIWTSFLGVIMSLAGLVLGFVRWRQARARPGGALRLTPYRERWFRWHHYLGFLFGLVTFTWVFSGLLSMTPMNWSPETGLTQEERLAWQGGELDPEAFVRPPGEVLERLREAGGPPVRLLRGVMLGGEPYWVAHQDWATTRVVAAGVAAGGAVPQGTTPEGTGPGETLPGETVAGGTVAGGTAPGEPLASGPPVILERFPRELLVAGVERMRPTASITAVTPLEGPDAYYYSRYSPVRFPALRVEVDDPQGSWFYLDPATGGVAHRYERRSRLNRWIYHGLHSFDFPGLDGNRPLWDILVLFLMAGGTALSVTGVVLTGRWMERKTKR